jgi:hypothetical protein
MGCLQGGSIGSFRIPDALGIAGHPPVHWNYPA